MGSEFLNRLGKELLLFDGAMGTMIQNAGAVIPKIPEEINVKNPSVIKDIYKKYINAGSDIISTNTFGSNSYKLESSEYSIKEIIGGAQNIAKEAVLEGKKGTLVAYDMGPIGVMMKPIGTLSFENAYDIFKEQVLLLDENIVDVVIIETMTDISELRAAILAVKENSNLPVIASMSFNEDCRTLMGTDPETMVYILEGLSVDVLGVNCSMGPVELSPIVKRILAVSNTPVIVQANAGLPANINGVHRKNWRTKKFIWRI
jgi:5-methyltetrahydrofolate--homocysteine methyltransferase